MRISARTGEELLPGARELADRAGDAKPSMSLDVYSHAIAPDEVDPDA